MQGVLDELVEEALPAPTVPVAEKLHWLLQRILEVLENGIGRGGVAAVLRYGEPRRGWAQRTVDLLAPAVTAD
jgi:hypothetical protein